MEVEALTEALNTGGQELATKRDLIELKFDMLKWIVSLALAQMGLLIGILLKLS